MKVKRPKAYTDEPEEQSVQTGSFDSFTIIPKDDKPKRKPQIGFIRQKPKRRKKCES